MTILLKIIAGLILYLIAATTVICIIDLGHNDINSGREFFEALGGLTIIVIMIASMSFIVYKLIPWCIMTLWGM